VRFAAASCRRRMGIWHATSVRLVKPSNVSGPKESSCLRSGATTSRRECGARASTGLPQLPGAKRAPALAVTRPTLHRPWTLPPASSLSTPAPRNSSVSISCPCTGASRPRASQFIPSPPLIPSTPPPHSHPPPPSNPNPAPPPPPAPSPPTIPPPRWPPSKPATAPNARTRPSAHPTPTSSSARATAAPGSCSSARPRR
jgi:hypothetical protein